MAAETPSIDWRGRFIRYAPVFLWIAVIFYLSSDSGSLSQTSRFIRPIVLFFFPDISEASLQIVHGVIRKCAHVFEYGVLALLILRAMWTSHFETLRRFKYVIPVVFVVVIASIDEYNQSLSTTRSGTIQDVLLDTAGGIFAVTIVWLFLRRRQPSGPKLGDDR
jgi:VanZ family protein